MVNVCLIEWALSKPPTAKMLLLHLSPVGHRFMPWFFKASTEIEQKNAGADCYEYPPEKVNSVVVLGHKDGTTLNNEIATNQ